jgi:hypothetical protein
MREWGKRQRERGDIIKESEGGGKRLRQSQKAELQRQNKETRDLETGAECTRWKSCSKQLLDDGQGKQSWKSRNGMLPKAARKIRQATTSAPSGRGQKERLDVERD